MQQQFSKKVSMSINTTNQVPLHPRKHHVYNAGSGTLCIVMIYSIKQRKPNTSKQEIICTSRVHGYSQGLRVPAIA